MLQENLEPYTGSSGAGGFSPFWSDVETGARASSTLHPPLVIKVRVGTVLAPAGDQETILKLTSRLQDRCLCAPTSPEARRRGRFDPTFQREEGAPASPQPQQRLPFLGKPDIQCFLMEDIGVRARTPVFPATPHLTEGEHHTVQLKAKP